MRIWLPLVSAIVAVLAGCGMPSLLITPVSSSTDLKEEAIQPGRGMFPDKILLIELEGTILNTRTGGLLQAKENDVSLITQQLEKAANDPSVKVVVLRVNSPGGTVAASDTIYQEVLRFKKKTGRPVIAYGQDVMASGAYYVACAADQIMCQPTSIVGSVGVIFQSFDVSGTMNLIGVRSTAIKSGPMKDMGSPFKPLGDEEKVVMQGMVDDFFHRFKGLVGTSRKLEGARLDAVTDGRVFTGEKALAMGLVDRTGTLNDALDLARQLGKTPDAEVVLYKRPYGYSGSIYARAEQPAAQTLAVQLLPQATQLPTGFYYLWNP
ncbi:MAG: signal peptide peptidase SppA [Tepidisphaeraceae bacterium]|jgi:protease-4